MAMASGKQTLLSLLMVACCTLAGCATTGKFEEAVSAWKGRSDTDLVKYWGQPTETFNSGGHKFLVYQYSRTKPLSIMGDPTGSPVSYMKSLYCTAIFDVSDGHVADWATKGNDCKDVLRPDLWKTAF
jgi:hypothetical protein